MKSSSNRREFIKKGAQLCFAYGTVAICPGIVSMANPLDSDEIPDPKKLNFCGYSCPPDCKFKQAIAENDIELKKECYKEWKIKEQHGIEFDPEKVVCYECKTNKEFKGVVVENCPVRQCALDKKLNSCIECNELETCDKELWQRFPDFYKHVKQLQDKLLTAS